MPGRCPCAPWSRWRASPARSRTRAPRRRARRRRRCCRWSSRSRILSLRERVRRRWRPASCAEPAGPSPSRPGWRTRAWRRSPRWARARPSRSSRSRGVLPTCVHRPSGAARDRHESALHATVPVERARRIAAEAPRAIRRARARAAASCDERRAQGRFVDGARRPLRPCPPRGRSAIGDLVREPRARHVRRRPRARRSCPCLADLGQQHLPAVTRAIDHAHARASRDGGDDGDRVAALELGLRGRRGSGCPRRRRRCSRSGARPFRRAADRGCRGGCFSRSSMTSPTVLAGGGDFVLPSGEGAERGGDADGGAHVSCFLLGG